MARRHGTHDARMRERLVREAARIMAEEGVGDFGTAKRKAAARLGAPDTRNLPQNREVQAALREHQQLFEGEALRERLRRLRGTALEAMALLEPFRPRLVGSVLKGTATAHSDVNLHLFSEPAEEVAIFLMDRRIPFEEDSRRLRFGRDDYRDYPVYRFLAGDTAIDLTVFSLAGLRQAPRSSVDGQPMERAARPAVERLLEEGEPDLGPAWG